MTIHQLKSDTLLVNISSKGAEIVSIKHIQTGEEFIWDGNQEVWNRHAPVLFPIVGKLNENQFQYKGSFYSLGQHGFARDLEFEAVEIYSDVIRFLLESNEDTLKVYPFAFKLFIEYKLIENQLETTYTVHNSGKEIQYFSIGAHPAFLLPDENLENFSIHFNQAESNLQRFLIMDGLQTGQTTTVGLSISNELELNANSFDKDAIIFKNLNSNEISIRHKKSNWQVKMCFEEFPFFGIWSKHPHQKFICLEPWAGITDIIGFKGGIKDKEGICNLGANESKSFCFKTKFSGAI